MSVGVTRPPSSLAPLSLQAGLGGEVLLSTLRTGPRVMNFKTTYILFELLGLMLAILGIVLYPGPTPPPRARASSSRASAPGQGSTADQVDKVVVRRKKSGRGRNRLLGESIRRRRGRSPHPERPPPTRSRSPASSIRSMSGRDRRRETRSPAHEKAGLDKPDPRHRPARRRPALDADASATATPGEGECDRLRPVVRHARQDARDLQAIARDRIRGPRGVPPPRNCSARTPPSMPPSSSRRARSRPSARRRTRNAGSCVSPAYGDIDIGELLGATHGPAGRSQGRQDNRLRQGRRDGPRRVQPGPREG